MRNINRFLCAKYSKNQLRNYYISKANQILEDKRTYFNFLYKELVRAMDTIKSFKKINPLLTKYFIIQSAKNFSLLNLPIIFIDIDIQRLMQKRRRLIHQTKLDQDFPNFHLKTPTKFIDCTTVLKSSQFCSSNKKSNSIEDFEKIIKLIGQEEKVQKHLEQENLNRCNEDENKENEKNRINLLDTMKRNLFKISIGQEENVESRKRAKKCKECKKFKPTKSFVARGAHLTLEAKNKKTFLQQLTNQIIAEKMNFFYDPKGKSLRFLAPVKSTQKLGVRKGGKGKSKTTTVSLPKISIS